MLGNKKIIVNYNSPTKLVDKECIEVRIPNELGFAEKVMSLFNRNGEPPGAETQCTLMFDEEKSTEDFSYFSGTINFDSPGYRSFFIKIKINGKWKELKLNSETGEAEFDEGQGNLAFWKLFIYLAEFKTAEWIKGGIMYQIFVDTFCSVNLPEEMKGKVVSWDTYPKWQKDEDGIYRNNQFYGGNLRGIIQKVDEGYFTKLNITVLYLTPVFSSPSQNRYDTSDYTQIDEMLGTWEELDELHQKLNRVGIKLVVDMVFNHSSNENKLLEQDPEMYSWMQKYTIPNCWWGYKHLVEFNKESENYFRHLAEWLQMYNYYMDGIRLDVADNLPDYVLKYIRSYWDKYILGEVWKNAVTGDFREFLVGNELDGVMNYQFPNAVYRYIRWGNYKYFKTVVEDICILYPPEALAVSPIFLSSHDIPRIPNILIGNFMKEDPKFENVWDMEKDGFWYDNDQFNTDRFRQWEVDNDQFSEDEWELIYELQALAVFFQYTLPGLPSIFAGDEAGVTGYKDPTNRKAFPWENINQKVYDIYVKMGAFRHEYRETFAKVDFEFVTLDEKKAIYRVGNLVCFVNRSNESIRLENYSFDNPVFALKEIKADSHVLEPYNAVVIKI